MTELGPLTLLSLLLRRVDAHTGGHWRLSCHCKRPGNRGFFGFHPSTCVPLPLRPMCQWHNSRYGVRMCINLEKLFLFTCNGLGTFHLNFLFFIALAAWLVTSTIPSPLHQQWNRCLILKGRTLLHAGLFSILYLESPL